MARSRAKPKQPKRVIEVWDYATWIAFANEARDQDLVWRQHELHARTNYRDQGDYELGGEG